MHTIGQKPFQAPKCLHQTQNVFSRGLAFLLQNSGVLSIHFLSLLFLQSAGACPSCLRREARPWTTAYSHCLNCRHLNAGSERNILNVQTSLCVSKEPISTVTSWPTSPVVIMVLVTLLCASRKTINTNGGLLSCVCVCDSEEFIKASPLKCTLDAALLWSAKTFGSACLRHCWILRYVQTHGVCPRLLLWSVLRPTTTCLADKLLFI